MALFAPTGNLLIGRVPWDPSYRHVRLYATESEQAAGMAGFCDQALSSDDYKYIRMNQAINVSRNAEELYGYNYVMYRNANYGTKWFYAFIVGVNYIAQGVTELVLETDVMQTWMFGLTFPPCMVEREHPATDEPGDNIVPEPAMDIQYIRQNITDYFFYYRYVCLMVNAYPHYNIQQTAVTGSDPRSGGLYDNVLSACLFLVYDLDNPGSVTSLKQDLDAFNGAGAADTIADAFMVPEGLIDTTSLQPLPLWPNDDTAGNRSNVWVYPQGTEANVVSMPSIARPSSLDGYTPRNKKLLTFPYCSMELGDYMGRTREFRWEWSSIAIEGVPVISLRRKSPMCSAMAAYVTAVGYGGQTVTNRDPEVFTVDAEVKCSWVYSAYQNWAAQNALSNQLNIVGGVAALAFSLAPSLPSVVQKLTAGYINLKGAEKPSVFKSDSTAIVPYSPNAASTGGTVSGLAGLAGAGAIASTLMQNDRMSRVPDTARGALGGNSKAAVGYGGLYTCDRVCKSQCAAVIDEFFDMFGYATDRVKVPETFSRKSWNYVKCVNSAIYGSAPADQLAMINQIYNAGVTFWHTDDIGNYKLDNSIVA